MVKVNGMDDDIKVFKSLRNKFTYSEREGNINVVKNYRATKKRNPNLQTFYNLILDNQKAAWNALPQVTKDAWNTKGASWGLTGYELYIQEGWKENFDAISGVGRSGGCFSNGAID